MESPDNATAILRAEHETILRACHTTEATARLLLRHQPVEPETLCALVQFFYKFVDGRHRHKEEDLLFPLFEQKHVGTEMLARSILDHQEGQWWIRSMDQLARAYRQGCDVSGRRWAETAANYAQMLRGHIETENQSLLPLIEKELGVDERLTLAAAFARAEAGAEELTETAA
jgi:hemerythrin-like domain-containing protein